MPDKTEEVSTYVDPETKRLIRMAAASENVGMSEFLRGLIRNELDRRIEEGNSIHPPVVAATAD